MPKCDLDELSSKRSSTVKNIQGRWIDKTWTATVEVEEASPSQREACHRSASSGRLTDILKSEGVKAPISDLQVVSVEYDYSNP
jgi:hypothetical protein